jgi:glucokinase
MVLAGDIGGTKTLIGLYDAEAGSARPRQVARREFATLAYPDLPSILRDFIKDAPAGGAATSASFGLAGPVFGRSAQLTNVPWCVDADDISAAFQIPRVELLNDLEAMAHGVPVLAGSELHVLQEGHQDKTGNMAVIAAGTGLGEALLLNVDGRFAPCASEAGHADFPARNDREIALAHHLFDTFGRAEVEHVVSGPGIVNIHHVTHTGACPVVSDRHDPRAPALIAAAAMAHQCEGCVEALHMFFEAYGAEAGNLALRSVATAGIFIGGGIAVKLLPALEDGRFLRAFVAKGAFEEMLRKVPVSVILNPEVGLLGAAVHASQGEPK